MPQVAIHDGLSLNTYLGDMPLPNGFVSVPVTTFKDGEFIDDIAYNGCPFVHETESSRSSDNVVFQDFWWLQDFV